MIASWNGLCSAQSVQPSATPDVDRFFKKLAAHAPESARPQREPLLRRALTLSEAARPLLVSKRNALAVRPLRGGVSRCSRSAPFGGEAVIFGDATHIRGEAC